MESAWVVGSLSFPLTPSGRVYYQKWGLALLEKRSPMRVSTGRDASDAAGYYAGLNGSSTFFLFYFSFWVVSSLSPRTTERNTRTVSLAYRRCRGLETIKTRQKHMVRSGRGGMNIKILLPSTVHRTKTPYNSLESKRLKSSSSLVLLVEEMDWTPSRWR